MADVFISYASDDQLIAEAICAALEGQGLSCWIATRDVLPSQTWAGAIATAIQACFVFVLVYSADSNRSGHVLRELQNAADADKPILPFRIEDVPPSPDMRYYLGAPQWLDALTQPMAPHVERLAETAATLVRLERRRASDAQRRTFWGNFSRDPTVKVVTGAIHNANLSAEFVSEWHMRTVSALTYYLPQVLGSITVQVAPPIFSPEHAHVLAGRSHQSEEDERRSFRRGFDDSIAADLTGCNLIVIGTADMNYATEHVLRSVYHVSMDDTLDPDGTHSLSGYVAFTQFPQQQRPYRGAPLEFRRLFHRSEEAPVEAAPGRGFWEYYKGHAVLHLVRDDISQDGSGGFGVLGHLVVAKWPIAPSSHNVVVVLDGPGVATYALAELLTG